MKLVGCQQSMNERGAVEYRTMRLKNGSIATLIVMHVIIEAENHVIVETHDAIESKTIHKKYHQDDKVRSNLLSDASQNNINQLFIYLCIYVCVAENLRNLQTLCLSFVNIEKILVSNAVVKFIHINSFAVFTSIDRYMELNGTFWIGYHIEWLVFQRSSTHHSKTFYL